MAETRHRVQTSLKALASRPLKNAAAELFAALGYSSHKTVDLDGTPSTFLAFVDPSGTLATKVGAQTEAWLRVEFLFQLTNDELPMLGVQRDPPSQTEYRTAIVESFVFLAIELTAEEWTRGALAGITREINRLFPMPVVILFKHGGFASLSVIDRRPSKKDESRDVIEGRISIVKDVKLADPHRAHVDILCDIALTNVKVRGRGVPTDFRDLYDGWLGALSAQTLNSRFYRELANWFFWSVKQVVFPAAAGERKEKRDEQNQVAVIRLLTRLIFVWFIKEKGLVPDELFEPGYLSKLLKEDATTQRESSTYYKAVLQNLFFATLNTEMSGNRKWRTKAAGGGLDGQYLIHTVYRYRDMFREPDRALELFKRVPFLNGGLFECLDRQVSPRDIERNPDLARRLVREGTRDVIRIDGFSERKDNPLKVPNKIFFAMNEEVDLNEEYDTSGKDYRADGVIELFSRYKFTVEENTPLEEEVALDPELLGKVFENLLASYNADTRTTARKKSGSFYTPREVVDYMVDEALIAYFEDRLTPSSKPSKQLAIDNKALEADAVPVADEESNALNVADRLRELLSYGATGNPFSNDETDALVSAIDNLRALDPACGSGAFPMGMLQKLIHVLHRLDPDNARWKAQNRRQFEIRLAAAKDTPDPSRREIEIEEAEAALVKLDRDFSEINKPDYARKLYLIDKCLFGVDVQPVAVQIAKLRFFISLVVSQNLDRSRDNANITALPNLETKLVAADSLIPIDRPPQADLFRDSKVTEKERELRAMNGLYFSARTAKSKRDKREKIAELRDELADLLNANHGLPESDARNMAAWDPFDQNTAAPFFDVEWMFGMSSRFDIVIGNPPYVRHEEIKSQKPLLAKHYGGERKDRDGDVFGSYAGTADLFVYFIQRGIELLRPGGAFAFITSNKWYRAKYGERLRRWMNSQARLRRIVDFGDADVFDAIAYPTILIATRRETPVKVPSKDDNLRVFAWPTDRDKSDIPEFARLVDETGFDMPQRALTADGWHLEPLLRRDLLKRIRLAGKPLGKYVEGRFHYGIKTGFNDAFIIDGPTKERLTAQDHSAARIIKPFLHGRDIKRWRVEPRDLWLLKLESSENVRHLWTGMPDREAERVFAKTYPAVHEFMIQYRSQLSSRRDQGKFFWELRSCAYWQAFEQPKLIYPDIAQGSRFAWDTTGSYSGDTTFFLPNPPRWLVALLNSSTIEWFYSQISPRIQNGFLRFKTQYLETIPVPNGIEKFSAALTTMARILEQDQPALARFDQCLNALVYELFFQDDLHAHSLTLLAEINGAGLARLGGLDGAPLVREATAFSEEHLAPGARLRAMLSDLQGLDVVRIVEGRE